MDPYNKLYYERFYKAKPPYKPIKYSLIYDYIKNNTLILDLEIELLFIEDSEVILTKRYKAEIVVRCNEKVESRKIKLKKYNQIPKINSFNEEDVTLPKSSIDYSKYNYHKWNKEAIKQKYVEHDWREDKVISRSEEVNKGHLFDREAMLDIIEPLEESVSESVKTLARDIINKKSEDKNIKLFDNLNTIFNFKHTDIYYDENGLRTLARNIPEFIGLDVVINNLYIYQNEKKTETKIKLIMLLVQYATIKKVKYVTSYKFYSMTGTFTKDSSNKLFRAVRSTKQKISSLFQKSDDQTLKDMHGSLLSL